MDESIMSDIVIVEAVRSRGRSRPQGLARDTRPDELAAASDQRGSLARVPQVDAGRGRGRRPRLRHARGRAGPQRRARRRRSLGGPARRGAGDDHQPLLLERPAGDRHRRRGAIAHRRERRRRRRRRRVDVVCADDRQQALASPRADGARARRSTRRWASRPRTCARSSASRARSRTSSRCAASRAPSAAIAKTACFDDEIVAGRRAPLRRATRARRATSRVDELPAPRHHARGARHAQAGVRRHGHASRPATARRSPTAPPPRS